MSGDYTCPLCKGKSIVVWEEHPKTLRCKACFHSWPAEETATDKLRKALRAELREDRTVEESLLALDERLDLNLTTYQAAVLEDWYLRLEAERKGT